LERHADRIRLLITDVVMPEMNGRELADRLCARLPDFKVLFVSGYPANVIANRGILETGVHFVQKPFSHRTLAQKIREALDGETGDE
jgi:FixJ family two-component response regulator